MKAVDDALEAASRSSITKNAEIVEKKVSEDETYAKLRARVGSTTVTVRLVPKSNHTVSVTAEAIDGSGFWFFEDPASLHRVSPGDVPSMMRWIKDGYT